MYTAIAQPLALFVVCRYAIPTSDQPNIAGARKTRNLIERIERAMRGGALEPLRR
jgi:hypothetical protein